MLNLVELAMWTGAFCAFASVLGFIIERKVRRED